MDIASGLRLLRNPTLVLTIVAPLVTYYALHAVGVGDVVALAVSAVFPLAALAVGVVRTHRVDAIGLVSFVGIAVGVVTALLVHDPRILLMGNALPGLAVGLVFLGSLATRRSMIEQMAGQLAAIADADPAVRARFRQMTLVWGLALALAFLLHVAVVFTCSTSTAVALSPVISIVVLAPVAFWTLRLRARARRLEPSATA